MQPIRVLVVEHTAVGRQIALEALGVDPALEVVGTAGTGPIALSKAESLRPDVVVLDGGLPGTEVLDVVRTLRASSPDVVLLLVAVPTPDGAALALQALDAGAADVVTAPGQSAGRVERQRHLLAELVPRAKELFYARRRQRSPKAPAPARAPSPAPSLAPSGAAVVAPAAPPVSRQLAEVLEASGVRLTREPPVPRPARGNYPYSVLVIAASTGGPDALTTLFRSLDASLRTPVLVVQHMPATFTPLLAERLDRQSGLEVREACDGDVALPGQALVAPGEQHMELHREGTRLVARLTKAPRENFVRPAADVLFRTAAQACGQGVLATVLTGMGRDGLSGARAIRDAGGTVLVQDQATSVVWGMPGAVSEAGLADEVLPIGALGAALMAKVRVRG